MSSLIQVATQYRSLRFCNIAEELEQLVSRAEANELTYLQFAEELVTYEPDLFIVYTENAYPENLYSKNRGLVIKLSYWIN